MSRIVYKLETAAPHPHVWVQVCDVCKGTFHAPAWSERVLPSLAALNDEGWRALSNAARDAAHEETGKWLPWDTCPDCLSKEQLVQVAVVSRRINGVLGPVHIDRDNLTLCGSKLGQYVSSRRRMILSTAVDEVVDCAKCKKHYANGTSQSWSRR